MKQQSQNSPSESKVIIQSFHFHFFANIMRLFRSVFQTASVLQPICKLFIRGSMTPALTCLLLSMLVAASRGQSCDSGSFFDGAECSPCNAACASCISQTICTLCHPQTYLAVTDTGLSCRPCTELIEGCAVCASKDACSACLPGFSLNHETCSPSEGGGMVELSHSQVTCQSYETNINGACHPAIPLCLKYNPDASCQVCQKGTILIQNYCIPSSIASMEPPQTQTEPAALVCQQRQFISNGECVTIGPACLNFLINGTCTECDTGYTLFRGLCVQDPHDDHTIISYIPTLPSRNGQNNNNSQQSHEDSPPTPPTAIKNTQNHDQNAKCNHSCATCTQDPSYCLTCIEGFVTVDSLPGQCFQL